MKYVAVVFVIIGIIGPMYLSYLTTQTEMSFSEMREFAATSRVLARGSDDSELTMSAVMSRLMVGSPLLIIFCVICVYAVFSLKKLNYYSALILGGAPLLLALYEVYSLVVTFPVLIAAFFALGVVRRSNRTIGG